MTIEITSVVISVQWWLVLLITLALFGGVKRKRLLRLIQKLFKDN